MKFIEHLKLRWVSWVWKQTPNCAQMSQLTSRSCEQALPLKTRLRMRLHYVICVWCKRYQKQVEFLHAAAPQLDDEARLPAARGLSAEARERLLQRLRNA